MEKQIQEAITAEEVALTDKVMAIVPSKNYGYQTASELADAIIKKANGENGISRIEGLAMVSCLAEAFNQAVEALKNDLADDAANWPNKKLPAFGVELEAKETGTRYNYGEDSDWKKLTADLKAKSAAFDASVKDLKAQIKGKEVELREGGKVSKTFYKTVTVKLL